MSEINRLAITMVVTTDATPDEVAEKIKDLFNGFGFNTENVDIFNPMKVKVNYVDISNLKSTSTT